jgi:hypothetical protein
MREQNELVKTALRLLVERCPRLAAQCYWAGTSCIVLEELRHRTAFDIHLHTRQALLDVRPLLVEVTQAFPGAFELLQAPDEFGSGFRGLLKLPAGEAITVEVLSNFEEPSLEDLVPSTIVPDLARVSLRRYLADKIQSVAERAEARDLVDIYAVLKHRPDLASEARRLLHEQDALLLCERLLSSSNEEIKHDLRSYPDTSPEDACQAGDLLLDWLKVEGTTAT